jgi:phosphatidylglycerophosphate synthase
VSDSPASYQPTERRPIASRNLRIVQWISTTLVRANVSPNMISIAGMICAIVGGFAFAATSWWPDWQRAFWLIAALMIQMRLMANLLDGMVAIESGKASPVGELYNEVPDRVSDAALLAGAGYALGGDVALGFTAACVAIFTAYVRAMGKAAGGPQDYCGPMAKPQRMFVMTCVGVYLGIAPADWQPTWHDRGIVAAGLLVIILGGIVTSLRRLLRLAAFLKRAP